MIDDTRNLETWYNSKPIAKLDRILESFAQADGNSKEGSNFFKNGLTLFEVHDYFSKSNDIAVYEGLAYETFLIIQKLLEDKFITVEMGLERNAEVGDEKKELYSIALNGIIFYEEGGYAASIKQKRELQRQSKAHSILLIYGSFLAGFGTIALVLVELFNSKNIYNSISVLTALFILIAVSLATLIFWLLITEIKTKIKASKFG